MNAVVGNTELDLTILTSDGPMTCIWKAAYGKGWLKSSDILKMLEDCHFAQATLRNALTRNSNPTIERRPLLINTKKHPGVHNSAKEYRVIEGSKPPHESGFSSPRTRIPRDVKPAVKGIDEASANDAFHFTSLMFASRN